MCIIGFAVTVVPATAVSLPVAESETSDFQEQVEAVHSELQSRVRLRKNKMSGASSQGRSRCFRSPHRTKPLQLSSRLRAEFSARNGFGGPMSS